MFRGGICGVRLWFLGRRCRVGTLTVVEVREVSVVVGL